MLPAELARRTGSTRGAVSHWYSGRSEPEGQRLVLAAEALGVRAKWLATGDGERYVEPPQPARADTRVIEMVAGPLPRFEGEDEEEIATMEMRRNAAELVRAWMALPENERDDFKRQIEVASLRYRRKVPDRKVEHLAAPTAPSRSGKPLQKRRKPTGHAT